MQFIMILNLQRNKVKALKVFSQDEIKKVSAVAFGPFDNGYICVGFEDGTIIGFSD